MTSFKFPPPPPPPPKAASDAQPSYSSQRGGSSRGRGGDRGRGRGGQGRGGSSFSQGRGNNSSQGYGNAHGGRGGARGGYGGLTQHEQPLRQPATANAYGISAYSSQPQATAHTQPQANPQAPRFSPGQHAGHKRKRPEHNTHVPPLPPKKPQSGPKPPRAKAAAPPPVPSFGFALPAPAAVPAAAGPNHKRDGKKRVNLGLGAQHVVDGSSSDEDVDEEAAFADKVKVEGVAFEHDGEMISLQTAADVQAYIQDRRRNFPTQQRIAEKAQEAAAKREHELDFLYRVKGKKRPSATEAPPPPKPDHRPRPVDPQKQEELAALRKKLHESMLHKQQNRAPPPSNLLGAGYDSETDADAESSVLSESSVVSESEDSSNDDDDDDDDGDGNEQDSNSDSDTPPSPTSSKIPLPSITVPPPPPAPTPTPSAQLCKNWAQTGRCRFGRGCRWAHPAGEGRNQDQDQDQDLEQGRGKGKGKGKAKSREMPVEKKKEKEKMGLYEKLVEQELERGERVALAAVKYLGQNGFLG